jgi:hypothetical protein
VPLQKYFVSGLTQIRCISLAVPPTEGRIAIVTDAGWDAVDVKASGAQLAIAGRDEPRERSAARRMIGAFCVR